MAVYAATIFTSALLLFLVQPLISRFILPWFGGSPAVWSTAILFFQVLLFLGYVYAHASIQRLPARGQALLHVALLLAAAATLPILPDAAWKPEGAEDPRWHILLLLAVAVGLPYFVLSTTGPLLQAWFARSFPGVSPYRLYALSNLGSLIGLLAYPVAVEPALALSTQGWSWSALFVVFALGCGWCAWQAHGITAPVQAGAVGEIGRVESAPSLRRRVAWITMAAIPSTLLLATTNQMCQDVAVVPFLWVIPLAVYLLSLILCFDNEGWYDRSAFWTLTIVSLVATVVIMDEASQYPVLHEIVVYSLALFSGSMVCHGELVRRKPHPVHLTGFYLCVSLGGALGGVFVSLLAPLLFDAYLELQLSLAAVVVLGLLVAYRDPASPLHAGRPIWAWLIVATAAFVFGRELVGQATEATTGFDTADRNFYGIVRTYTDHDPDFGDDFRILVHGRVDHGFQYQSEENRDLALSYYGPGSGVELAFRFHPRQQARKIGVVGLGVGTLAALARAGDDIRFYEINPVVDELARQRFDYLDRCPASWSVALGDARLLLERELVETKGRGREYDLLVLDAFSGDAPPVHLLTLEAVELYLRHLAPDGILAMNISNRHLDLSPVIWGVAAKLGIEAVLIESWEDLDRGLYDAWWMVMTRNQAWLNHPEVKEVVYEIPENETRPHEHLRLWTDDYSNLFQLLLNWETDTSRSRGR